MKEKEKEKRKVSVVGTNASALNRNDSGSTTKSKLKAMAKTSEESAMDNAQGLYLEGTESSNATLGIKESSEIKSDGGNEEEGSESKRSCEIEGSESSTSSGTSREKAARSSPEPHPHPRLPSPPHPRQKNQLLRQQYQQTSIHHRQQAHLERYQKPLPVQYKSRTAQRVNMETQQSKSGKRAEKQQQKSQPRPEQRAKSQTEQSKSIPLTKAALISVHLHDAKELSRLHKAETEAFASYKRKVQAEKDKAKREQAKRERAEWEKVIAKKDKAVKRAKYEEKKAKHMCKEVDISIDHKRKALVRRGVYDDGTKPWKDRFGKWDGDMSEVGTKSKSSTWRKMRKHWWTLF